MFPLADGALGSADEIAAGFLAFILLVVVIGIVIRDEWRKRKHDHQEVESSAEETDRLE